MTAKQPHQTNAALSPAVNHCMQSMLQRFPSLQLALAPLEKTFQAMVDTFQNRGILFLCGNGGSFADAMHIKGELAKQFETPRPIQNEKVLSDLNKSPGGSEMLLSLERGLPVIVLGESHSLRSAYENDRNPIYSYAQELNSFAERIQPACLMGISTSGNAKNVIAAMTLAKAYGITTIAFTGPAGGEIAKQANIWLPAVGENAPQIQESQVILYHTLCRMLEAHFFAS